MNEFKIAGHYMEDEERTVPMAEKQKCLLNLGDMIKVVLEIAQKLNFIPKENIIHAKELLQTEFEAQKFMSQRRMMISSIQE